MEPDIRVELPDGWVRMVVEDGVLTFSPDNGRNVLQISVPWWGNLAGDWEDGTVEESLQGVVESGRLGRVVAMSWSRTSYARVLRAEIDSDAREASAWLIIPERDQFYSSRSSGKRTWTRRERSSTGSAP